jgi:hypothetical protein
MSLVSLSGSERAPLASATPAGPLDPGLGLEITGVAAGSRRIKVAGSLGELSAAFGVTLRRVTSTGPGGQVVTHRYREGAL